MLDKRTYVEPGVYDSMKERIKRIGIEQIDLLAEQLWFDKQKTEAREGEALL